MTVDRNRMSLVAALFLAFATSAASQQSAPGPSDLRCLVASIVLASSNVPALRSAGLMSSLYFLGHVDASAPGGDLEARLKGALRTSTGQQVRTDAKSCGDQLKARGAVMQAIGRDLQREGGLPKLSS